MKLTVAWPLPAMALPIVGAAGADAGVMVLEAADAELVPALLVAVTEQL